MQIVRSVRIMRRHAERLRHRQATIGLVPTMGALHEGHLSLVRAARRQCDIVIASIFVNPSQFGPKEDYARYPRNSKSDTAKLKSAGVDLVFLPSVRAMYPEGFDTWVTVGEMGGRLEGRSRPGHFTGVATIVLKKLNIIRPHIAYFGRKDYQQTVIIRRMVRDLNIETKIILGSTIRERDGLAISSRNRYFSSRERSTATVLWKALQAGRKSIRSGMRQASKVCSVMIREISKEPLAKIDYITVADPDTLEEVHKIEKRVVLAIAVRIGKTRLIDNVSVTPR